MLKYVLISMRPKQWIKNLFIFLPLVFGRKMFSFPENVLAVAAFFLFSLIAGAVYIVNDILDAERDKTHPVKSLRPVASGRLKARAAWNAAFVTGAIALGLSFALNMKFGWMAAGYLLFNLVYSKFLKNAVIIDVFCIGVFFLFRIIAGGIIAGVVISRWILIMTALLALFLGFNKRRQELKLQEKGGVPSRKVLEKYNAYFIDQMISVVTSSIVVVYMLYTLDSRTVSEAGSTHLMYSIPFVYYGIFRYLYLIHKHHEDGDPTRILLRDAKMQINLALWIIVCIAVIYFGV
ncbi:MAG: decaprenyl-phosphate phosphoribosyltransferase [Candidatus Omnitrophota bacterium]